MNILPDEALVSETRRLLERVKTEVAWADVSAQPVITCFMHDSRAEAEGRSPRESLQPIVKSTRCLPVPGAVYSVSEGVLCVTSHHDKEGRLAYHKDIEFSEKDEGLQRAIEGLKQLLD